MSVILARPIANPDQKMFNMRRAVTAEYLVATRDAVIHELFERGIDYSDFVIVEKRSTISLRTVLEPLPPRIYDAVREALESVGGDPAHDFAPWVTLADDPGDWMLIDPRTDVFDQGDFLRCSLIFEHIGVLKREITAWQSTAGDETEVHYWPVVDRKNENRLCIMVSFGSRYRMPVTEQQIYRFVRSLPEYRRV